MIADLAAIQHTIRRGRIITVIALVAVAAVFYVALVQSPIDAIQGPAFRIIYLHVPAAAMMECAFGLVGVVGILFLFLKDERLDLFAESSAEAGMMFGTIVLLTGPLWGKGVWGVWWEWEPRLTFTLLLYLLFAGYFAMRSALAEPAERARFAAVIGIMALVLIPFIHLATDLWPSQHPQHVFFRQPTDDPTKPHFAWPVTRTILESLGAFTLLYVGLVTMRYGIGSRRKLEEVSDA